MSAPTGYTRSLLLLHNEQLRALNEVDAHRMIGFEITAELHGAMLACGTVTKAEVVQDGRRMAVTVEAGGRACQSCGHVYPLDQLDQLTTFGDLVKAMPSLMALTTHARLPAWSQLCKDPSACLFRRMDDPPPYDGESPCRAGCDHSNC